MLATALADPTTIVRLSLHVLAASVWVGGQLVLGGLIPTVRTFGEDAPRRVAQVFGRLSWPAFWVLIATGLWNYAADATGASSTWQLVATIKILVVVIAGLGAFLHTRATSAAARGAWAGLSALFSIAALVLGVALAG